MTQMVEGERDKETADDVSRLSADLEESKKSREFLNNTVFKLVGTQNMGVVIFKKNYMD